MEESSADADWIRAVVDGNVTRYRKGRAVVLPQRGGALAVAEGMVQVTMLSSEGRERELMTLRPGDLFAAPQALDDYRGGTDLLAFALTDCSATHLSDADIVEAVARNASLVVEFLRRSAENTARLLIELERIAFSDSVALIASILAERGQSNTSLALSQEKLAHITGKTRVTVASALYRLREQGLIAMERSKIRILDGQALLEIARGG